MRVFTRLLAVASTVALAGMASSLGALAQEDPGIPPEQAPAPEPAGNTAAPQSSLSELSQKNLSEFGSCIASSKSADLLFVLDQSASLVGYQGSTPTDAESFRVDATRDIATQLAHLGADSGASINVKLAGFGSEYYSDSADYGEWVDVSGNPDALKEQIEKFRSSERVADLETDYGTAYAGALREMAQRPSNDCRAVVFFTDGNFYSDEAQGDIEGAKNALCADNSAVAALRSSHIRLFNVGLVPPEDADSQVDLLTRLSENQTCTGHEPNGAFFNAGQDPAALFAAFRNLIPTSGGMSKNAAFAESFDFVLDDSITPVRLSAIPKTSVREGELVPTLTGPDGQTVDLTPETTRIAGAETNVSVNDKLPGMVDVSMSKAADGARWAGEWTFGYRVAEGSEGEYSASMVMIPGLSVNLTRADGGEAKGGINSDEVIKAQLVDGAGNPRSLEGEGLLSAAFLPSQGDPIPLVENQPIVNGEQVDIPLEAIDTAVNGRLATRVDITTKGADDAPGTRLNPIEAETSLTVTPSDMPSVGSVQVVTMDDKEVTIDVPASGPGKIWVADQSIGAQEGTLPDGVDKLAVSSTHNSADTALELGEGEQGTIPVTLRMDTLADGPLNAAAVIDLQSADGQRQAQLPLELQGSVTTPVNKTVFGVAMVLAIVLALLIPLAILYLMKFVSGRIPRRPKLFVKTIPVRREGTRLIRTDKGGDFVLDPQEFFESVPVTPAGRSVNLGTYPVRVRSGLNPFTPAQAVVDKAGTISGKGRARNGHAVLPLAVHNGWFLAGNPADPDSGEIVVAVDNLAQSPRVAALSEEIRANAPALFDSVELPAVDTPPGGPGAPSAQGGSTWTETTSPSASNTPSGFPQPNGQPQWGQGPAQPPASPPFNPGPSPEGGPQGGGFGPSSGWPGGSGGPTFGKS
ncbi:vWA domain-containing protein [Corynebacterium flavescens]|uniref:vWA domain-containing protein n=1 Tax=Corynebacterium flavescens TaxID=28028 RepID=UPI003F8FE3B4